MKKQKTNEVLDKRVKHYNQKVDLYSLGEFLSPSVLRV